MSFNKLLIISISMLTCISKGLQAPAQQLSITPFRYEINKQVSADHGAVVSAHPLASQVGAYILQKGGNAIDAAIASQLALAVVYPGAGNIGGGGVMVARLSNGQTIALDFRETAPGKASRDMYLDKNGEVMTQKSKDGHLAAGVPGTIAGLFASMKYARLPFKVLIQPAIDLAEKGFAITEREARSLNENQGAFLLNNTRMNAFIKIGGWKAGDTLIQKDLATTLKRIQLLGRKGFYEGITAKLIVEEMKRGGGIISLQDLKQYQAKERSAMLFNYKGYEIITMPLPSSGGILLQQMLNMASSKNISSMGFQTKESVQFITEIERRAYADRAEFLGDADFVKVPVKKLTSMEYALQRIKDFDSSKAGNSQIIKAGNINKESEETTHLSILDKDGNAVSVTTTLNGSYGSKTVVAGAGFLLNNEMDDFSVKPGTPNLYGAVGNEQNAIAPGKRMLSSMTPTIVLKNNKPYMVVGTPGGTTITTSVFQSLLNVLDFDMNAVDAVNKPKFHHQWLPDVIYVESDFPKNVSNELQKMGYKIVERQAIGRTEMILINDGKIIAVGDKRGDDAAVGY
jgi:gamma-glutamyltranspeptidase/glutathione hydrolase